MLQDDELHKLLDSVKIFDKMYELIRLVDPVNKKVLSYKNNTIDELGIKCFDVWGKNQICNNCISMRAYIEKDTFVKIEYNSEKAYLVTALPFTLSDRTVVIELLKDVTNSLVIGNLLNEKNSELYQVINNMNRLTMQDPLTGIYNRRYLNEKLPIDLINAILSEQHIAIIMADIDFFKKVNDNYGHLTGDYTLKIFAETLRGCISRESDWAARFGGEEFVVCLPGASLEKAVEIAEDMRRAISAQAICCGEHTFKITSSFGVCSMKPLPGNTVEELLESADRKLYAAKNNGRNRVEF